MVKNETQQKWLDAISEHGDGADARRIADNLFDGDCTLQGIPTELVQRLLDLEYLERDDDRYRTRFPGAFGR